MGTLWTVLALLADVAVAAFIVYVLLVPLLGLMMHRLSVLW